MLLQDVLLIQKVKYVNWDHTRTHKTHQGKHTTKRTISLPLLGIAALVKLANNQRSKYLDFLLMMLMPRRKFVRFTSLILELIYIYIWGVSDSSSKINSYFCHLPTQYKKNCKITRRRFLQNFSMPLKVSKIVCKPHPLSCLFSRFDFLVIGAATLALIIETAYESRKYKACSFAWCILLHSWWNQ